MEEKNRGGRPRAEIPWQHVYNYASLGCTLEDICMMIGISSKTLRKYLVEDTGYESISQMLADCQSNGDITNSLRTRLIHKALYEGDTQALIHLDKSHRFGRNMDEYQAQKLKLKDKEIVTNSVIIEKVLGDEPTE